MPSSKPDVVVLCWNTPATSDRRAQAIAAFLGAESTCVALSTAVLGDGLAIRKLVPRCACLVVDVETLASAADVTRSGAAGLSGLTADLAEHVFVYGFEPTDRHAAVLRALSSDGLLGVEPLPDEDAMFQVGDGDRESCGAFSGLRLGLVDPKRDRRFLESSGGSRPHAIVRVAGKPFFVRTTLGGSQIFFLACAELADLDERVGREARVLSWFSRLVPMMMFLRGALGSRVWHNDNPRACFTIDDPLLRSGRYGFLEYRRLVESMRQRNFSTSIAFIPWNYRRSSSDVAKLFSSKSGVPSLCVHGCDHTRGEFATTDVDSLRAKAHTALERMQIHRQLSGVPFDDVMVFPQGLFSAEAIAALSAEGYLAAVNSDLFPSTQAEALVLRDLLEVAVTKFADFPLFCRRYPHDLGEFAFDLFFGKPALAVEHHGYFRDGYGALESFVERLKGLDERLEWSDLGMICSSACLTRTGADGEIHVRFYTNRFSLTNRGTSPHMYVLERQLTPDGIPRSVTIDGRTRQADLEDGQLKVSVSLAAGQSADIGVAPDQTRSIGPKRRQTRLQNAKVLIRRHLSEFRDNHMDTNRVLSGILAHGRS